MVDKYSKTTLVSEKKGGTHATLDLQLQICCIQLAPYTLVYVQKNDAVPEMLE
jgi:hypothetical protein